MAAVPVKVPQVSESVSEGVLSRWLKADGSTVKADEPLYELDTDKASQTFTAPLSGRLKIGVAEGEIVEVHAVIASIDPDASGEPVATPTTSGKPAQAATAVVTAPATTKVGSLDNGESLAPSVRRLITETKTDPSAIEGTGRDGRITKGDVLSHLESTPPAKAVPASEAPKPAPPVASPVATSTTSSGPRESRKRMTPIRQKIAQRLVEAQQTAAILTTFNEADMSRVMDLRAKYKDSFKTKHGVGLGFMSFFVKASIEALKAFPNVNGRIEGNEVITNHAYDIGVAVSTERGLMVPVVRDADQLSFAGIEKAIGAFAVKARDNKIAVTDLQGGTFTITNGGVFGSLLSTPILNPPQSGILGMHSIQKRPVVVDDQIVIRPMMYLALSYDHRIVDGKEAVSFLVRIKECLESPERLMLEL